MLVTGASGGIGEAIAVAFARGGAVVVVSSRNEEKLQSLAQRLKRLTAKRWRSAAMSRTENKWLHLAPRSPSGSERCKWPGWRSCWHRRRPAASPTES